MDAKISVKAMVLSYLKTGKPLTHMDALDMFKTNRLSAYIKFLRNDGWEIFTEDYKTPSGKIVGRYWLKLGQMKLAV